jgi:hypothetical protein
VNIGVLPLLKKVKVFSCKCSLSQVEHKAIKVLNYRRTYFVKDYCCVCTIFGFKEKSFGLNE